MMKKTVMLFVINATALIFMQMMSADSEAKENANAVVKVAATNKSTSVLGSTEKKHDEFMTEYAAELKAVLLTKDDKKIISLLKAMKEKYAPRVKKLKPEVEAWEKSMSESDQKAYEKRVEDKPWNKDVMTIITYSMGRYKDNSPVSKALKDLNDSLELDK